MPVRLTRQVGTVSLLGKASVILEGAGPVIILIRINPYMLWYVVSGITDHAHTGIIVGNGMSAGLVLKEANLESSTVSSRENAPSNGPTNQCR